MKRMVPTFIWTVQEGEIGRNQDKYFLFVIGLVEPEKLKPVIWSKKVTCFSKHFLLNTILVLKLWKWTRGQRTSNTKSVASTSKFRT